MIHIIYNEDIPSRTIFYRDIIQRYPCSSPKIFITDCLKNYKWLGYNHENDTKYDIVICKKYKSEYEKYSDIIISDEKINNNPIMIRLTNCANDISEDLFIYGKWKGLYKMIIITPTIRPHLLDIIQSQLNFEYINKWIIVYDETRISHDEFFPKKNNDIIEYVYTNHHLFGVPQKNYAISQIKDTDVYIYHLPDNIKINNNIYLLLYMIGTDKSCQINDGSFFYHYSSSHKHPNCFIHL